MSPIRTLAILLSALSLLLTACSNDEEEPSPQPQQLPVNYANLSGIWQVEHYDGHTLNQGDYVCLVLERRDHVFQLYDNLSSMYGQCRTGTYTLTQDEDSEQTILSGTYDNGVGEWLHEYTVLSLTDDHLTLETTDEPHERTSYLRLPALPDGYR